jgi:hypothetical protein
MLKNESFYGGRKPELPFTGSGALNTGKEFEMLEFFEESDMVSIISFSVLFSI